MNHLDLAAVFDAMARLLRSMPPEAIADALAQAAPSSASPQPMAIPAAIQAVAEPSNRTLNDWLDMHEKDLRTRAYKPHTLKNRLSHIAHMRRLWGTVGLTDLKPMAIRQALLDEFMPERSSTAGRVLRGLREAYSEAAMNDWVTSNPATSVKLPAHRVARQRLPFDVWRSMVDVSEGMRQKWVKALLLLAIVTGQRRADLAKMRFDDVVDGCLRVEQQKEAGKGYGARVAIPLALRMDAIGMSVGDVIEFCRTVGAPGSTILRQANGRQIEVSSLSARFTECLLSVPGFVDPGSRKRPSLHEARSLSARTYRASGLEVQTIQTLLGHSDSEMTDLYIKDRGLSKNEWKVVPLSQPSVVD